MKIKLWLCSVLFLYSFSLYSQLKTEEPVVCIHGILGAPWMMKCYVDVFEDERVPVLNWGYPSRDKTIEEHADELIYALQILADHAPGHPIHFVCHSMGSLVLRAAVNHPECPPEALIGRAVLLAPPNQGASWGRLLSQFSILRNIAKDEAGRQLMTETDFEHLGQFPLSMEILVIAGNRSINPFIPGENDGTVAVKETYLSTPHEHKIIKAGHKSILFNKKALSLTKEFIEQS